MVCHAVAMCVGFKWSRIKVGPSAQNYSLSLDSTDDLCEKHLTFIFDIERVPLNETPFYQIKTGDWIRACLFLIINKQYMFFTPIKCNDWKVFFLINFIINEMSLYCPLFEVFVFYYFELRMIWHCCIPTWIIINDNCFFAKNTAQLSYYFLWL